MIIKEEYFPSGDLSFLSQLGLRAEELIFFDIETTGLSAHNASLYLIGTVVHEGGSWKLQQLFAESLTDEIEMLEHFFALLSKKRRLLSFNGERFDIPFLEKLLSQYGLSESFQGVESLDLYRELRPAKKLLSLPNYQLKSCERFLGIQREDRFSGGELIYVYLDYLKTKDPKMEDLPFSPYSPTQGSFSIRSPSPLSASSLPQGSCPPPMKGKIISPKAFWKALPGLSPNPPARILSKLRKDFAPGIPAFSLPRIFRRILPISVSPTGSSPLFRERFFEKESASGFFFPETLSFFM